MTTVGVAEHSKDAVYVTGAASGIGRAVARLLAADGVPVVLLDRDASALDGARAAVAAGGAPAWSFACDVSDEQAVADAFAAAAAAAGPPAGLVCAAGIDRPGLAHELDAATFDQVIRVNLRGTFLTCRAALGPMMAAGRGSIVCLGSPLGFVGVPGGTSAYSASKGAISALVRTLAVDYAAHGVRVNALLPGPTETPLMWDGVAASDAEAVRRTIAVEVPLGRLAEPEEPARAALWLLSDAASYVTGSQIVCDGGVLAKASVSA